jgi:hypothetical protein
MQVGDLVMWTGYTDYGRIGIIRAASRIGRQDRRYEVVWCDRTISRGLYGAEIMVVRNAP